MYGRPTKKLQDMVLKDISGQLTDRENPMYGRPAKKPQEMGLKTYRKMAQKMVLRPQQTTN